MQPPCGTIPFNPNPQNLSWSLMKTTFSRTFGMALRDVSRQGSPLLGDLLFAFETTPKW